MSFRQAGGDGFGAAGGGGDDEHTMNWDDLLVSSSSRTSLPSSTTATPLRAATTTATPTGYYYKPPSFESTPATSRLGGMSFLSSNTWQNGASVLFPGTVTDNTRNNINVYPAATATTTVAPPGPLETPGGGGAPSDFRRNTKNPMQEIETLLARRDEELRLSILESTANATRALVDELIDSQLTDAWNQERERILRQMGIVSGSSFNHNNNAERRPPPNNRRMQPNGGSALLPLPSITGGGDLSYEQQQQQHFLRAPAALLYSSQQQQQSGDDVAVPSMWTLPETQQAHLQTMKQLKANKMVEIHESDIPASPFLQQQQSAGRDKRVVSSMDLDNVLFVTEQILRLYEPQPANPRNRSVAESFYVAHLKHLKDVVQVRQGQPLGRSFTPVDMAMATLVHLCKEMKRDIQMQVRNMLRAQSSSVVVQLDQKFRNDFANQCQQFVDSIIVRSSIDFSPWPCLYYCLRSGDAVAAREVFELSVTSLGSMSLNNSPLNAVMDPNSAEAAARILAAMARTQQEHACVWEASSRARLDEEDFRIVANLTDTLQRQWANATGSPDASGNIMGLFQLGFFCLLTGSEAFPMVPTVMGFNVIEDYMAAALWRAFLQADPVPLLVEKGLYVQESGQHEMGDFYVQALFLTQQLASGLQSLAGLKPFGLLQATHLALLYSTAGIEIVDLKERAITDVANGPFGATKRKAMQTINSSSDLVSDLLSAYVSSLVKAIAVPDIAALAAMEYLLHIPNSDRAEMEIAQLISQRAVQGQLELLVGTVNEKGRRTVTERTAPLLDTYFNGSQIRRILCEAGRLLIERGNACGHDRDILMLGIQCFMLGEGYAHIMQFFISVLTPASQQPDERKKFWMHKTQSFFAAYIDKETNVQEILRLGGEEHLYETCRTMIGLNVFFDLVRSGRLGEAGEKALSLHLLPINDAELAPKEKEYCQLPQEIQEAFPDFLAATMSILHARHVEAKQQAAASSSGMADDHGQVAQARLATLRLQANLIYTFSGMLRLRNGEALDQLSRLYSKII